MTSMLGSIQPPDVHERETFERLHPNARLNWILSNLVGVGILTLAGAIGEFIFAQKAATWPWPRLLPLISIVAGTLLAGLGVVTAILRFARFGYRLREKDLIVQSGLIWRTRRCVPRSRIQHVDIDSGPIDRAMGLVEVSLYVAGGIGAVAQIPGLAPEAAEQLKEALIVSRSDGV